MFEGKPRVAITMGDAAGIGPEVTLKALFDPQIQNLARYVVFGNSRYLKFIAQKVLYKKANVYSLKDIKDLERPGKGIAVLDFESLPGKFIWGKINPEIARAALIYIKEAANLCLKGKFAALVTAPVNKEAINQAGFKFSGHTEFLAQFSRVKSFMMMLIGGGWRVILVTRHQPLKKVSRLLSVDKIVEAVELGVEGLKKLGIKKPRIAVAAFNPHAGEGGVLGDEEEKIITPAVKKMKKKGIIVYGPLASDTLFLPRNREKYDAQVVMYHDQGLIPLKMSGFGKAVNVTWGLPFIRTSPGHGTAYELAGKGEADPDSMKEAIKLAVKLAKA